MTLTLTPSQVRTGMLHEVAAGYPDGYFTAMILLDHMDWMSEEHIQHEWQVSCRRSP